MKKYLLTSAAALAFCGLFTSCTHDFDNDGGSAAQNSVMKTYEQAFITAFGQPDPNQEWGFGPSVATSRAMTRALGDYDGYKGTMQPVVWAQDNTDWQWKWMPYTFPSDCDASNFSPDLTNVKSYKEIADAANQGGGFATGICYIDENHTGKIHIWGGNERAKLYFKAGTYDFTNVTFDLCQNADLYLLSGATLTLNNSAASTVKFNIYIASGAKLIVNGADGLRLDNGAKVYNHGEIETTKCEVNTTSMLYNVGTLTASDVIWVANNYSIIVNDGTMTSGNSTDNNGALKTLGSGRFQNNAEVTVYGKTIVNSNDNMWVNNGHYKTQYFEYTATSSNVINNCFLEVKEDFFMNVSDGSGDFKIDAGGGVLTKNFFGGGIYGDFNGGPFKITMGSRSVFKVTNEAHLNALASGIATNHYGFEGVGSDYAVFQANKVIKDGLGEGNVAYSGKLYVSAEEHFAQGYSGQYPYIHYYNGCSEANVYAPGFQSGTPDITINTTPCNPGFNDRDDDDPNAIRVICEDLSVSQASDWDFNDVVFDVKLDENNKVEITLRAAGGTLLLTVAGREVHELFKKENPNAVPAITSTSMVSTGSTDINDRYSNINLKAPKFTIDNNFGTTNVKEIAKAIPVQVFKLVNGVKDWYDIEWRKGAPSARIGVGTDYNWCDEREPINSKYSYEDMRGNKYDGFTMFSRGILNANEWYKYNGPITDEMARKMAPEYTGQ